MQHDHEPQWSWKSATWGIILALVIVYLFTAPWALAAIITINSGDSLQDAHDNAQPGDTLYIVGQHVEQRMDIRKRVAVECARDALLDGRFNRDSAFIVRPEAEDVTIINCRIARYANSGIRLRGNKNPVREVLRPTITGNTIQQIGSYWGCGPDVTTCVGYGGIHVTHTIGAQVSNNRLLDMRNPIEDIGKVHCLYISQGTKDSHFENNTCISSTGDMYKTRAAFRNTFVGNTCVDGPYCFVDAVPPDKLDEEPRSQDNELWLNVSHDMDAGFIHCRGEDKDDMSPGNCRRYGIITNDGPWHVSAIRAPTGQVNHAKPLRCPTGKKVNNLNGEADCNRCFKGSSDKRQCRRQCLPLNSRGERHKCARELM